MLTTSRAPRVREESAGVRGSPRKCSVETVCGGLVETLEEMPVRVESHLDRRVSEPELDHLGVLALGDQHGGMRMSQVVKPERLADRGPHRRKPISSAEVGAAERPAFGSGEHVPVRSRWPAAEVSRQLVGEESRQRHLTPCGGRLRWRQSHLPLHIGERLSDRQRPSEEIQPMHPHSGEFSEPAARVGGGQHQCPEGSAIASATSSTSSPVRKRISVRVFGGSLMPRHGDRAIRSESTADENRPATRR